MGRGPIYALGAAALFGLSTPLAKLLLGRVEPLALAALLYLGSGFGLACWRLLARGRARSAAKLQRSDLGWLAAAIAAGGVVAPILVLAGRERTTPASASLLITGGVVNATIAIAGGVELPAKPVIAGAALLGFASYGVSLALFVAALREVCTVRGGPAVRGRILDSSAR
ncbi:MAG: EamA family transporter [Acidobacteria bacterium]|nr:EamA family transporter [Acidobacteriota bacterium]